MHSVCTGSEDSVGVLAETLSDTGSEQLHYSDFFDPPLVHKRGSVEGRRSQLRGTSSSSHHKQQLSSHEKRQLKVC